MRLRSSVFHRCRLVEPPLTPHGRNNPSVNHAKCVSVIFDGRTTWRLQLEMIEAKASRARVWVYCLSKSDRLSANHEVTHHITFIRFIMTYACPAMEFAADTHLFKFQRLQNRFSTPLAILQGVHWFAKFIMFESTSCL
jgi:hypothetical protein